jgi:hypothetical protein
MSVFASYVAGSSAEETLSQTSSDRNKRLNQLVAQRELLETEADAIGSELMSPGVRGEPPAGIKTPLVDKDGFPRGDIDIYRVKLLRGRLACINTDHKRLMKEIENEIHALHQSAPNAPLSRHASERSVSASGAEALLVAHVDVKPKLSVPTTPGVGASSGRVADNPSSVTQDIAAPCAEPSSSSIQSSFVAAQYYTVRPFATLDQILPGSPAHAAGLQDGDALLRFGHVMLAGTAVGGEMPSSEAGMPQPLYRSASACMEQVPAVVNAAYQSGKSIRVVVRKVGVGVARGSGGGIADAIDMASSVVEERVLTPQLWSGRGLLGVHLTPR